MMLVNVAQDALVDLRGRLTIDARFARLASCVGDLHTMSIRTHIAMRVVQLRAWVRLTSIGHWYGR